MSLIAAAYCASKAAVHCTLTPHPILPPDAHDSTAYGETLSAEVAEFNIRVTVVVPGAFDTGLALPLVGTPIADYDRAREVLRKRVEEREKMPIKGDPAKAMDALMDTVKGEGKAAGKGKPPLWLFLGSDCLVDVKARADKLKNVADDWADVGTGLEKD